MPQQDSDIVTLSISSVSDNELPYNRTSFYNARHTIGSNSSNKVAHAGTASETNTCTDTTITSKRDSCANANSHTNMSSNNHHTVAALAQGAKLLLLNRPLVQIAVLLSLRGMAVNLYLACHDELAKKIGSSDQVKAVCFGQRCDFIPLGGK